MLEAKSNRLLASLGRQSLDELLAAATSVELPARHRVSEAGGLPESAYFILSGFASEVVQLEDGEHVEIGFVGYEGVTGTYHLLGPAASLSHCFIQMAGTAYQVPFPHLQAMFATSAEVREAILKYVQHQMAHLAQTAACNRMHDAGPRFARWLLTLQDRTQAEEFFITQQFLAQMLGTGRSTVNIVAKSFERTGLVGHRRGKIRILDRLGLQTVACACYETTRPMFAALYS